MDCRPKSKLTVKYCLQQPSNPEVGKRWLIGQIHPINGQCLACRQVVTNLWDLAHRWLVALATVAVWWRVGRAVSTVLGRQYCFWPALMRWHYLLTQVDAVIPTRNLLAASTADAGAHMGLLLLCRAGGGVSCGHGWQVPGWRGDQGVLQLWAASGF